MSAKQFLELVLYIALLIPALVFVHSYVLEYLEGKTFFVQTSKPIRFEDVPAITLCFGYNREQLQNLTRSEKINLRNGEYLKALNIGILLTDEPHYYQFENLTLNDNIKQSSDFEITLEQMQLASPRTPHLYYENCFRHRGPQSVLWDVRSALFN